MKIVSKIAVDTKLQSCPVTKKADLNRLTQVIMKKRTFIDIV